MQDENKFIIIDTVSNPNKRGVYKYYLDCGRMGDLEGVFIARPDDIQKIIGKRIYFGECLGKHSEIFTDFDMSQLTFVTDDQKVIDLFEKYDLSSGYNPFHYINEKDYNLKIELSDDWKPKQIGFDIELYKHKTTDEYVISCDPADIDNYKVVVFENVTIKDIGNIEIVDKNYVQKIFLEVKKKYDQH